MKGLRHYFILVLKGIGMGAANVIPGVSGGTVALITGIFEELIDSIKSFNLVAIRLIFKGKFKDFVKHVNLNFLVAVFFGVGISVLSLAKILDYLFTNYPVYIWAYFFGLILASIYFVGRTVERWNFPVVITFIVGTVIALSISVLNPATENDGFMYLILCGAVGVCSMILPGLSGSFVLILLGNYQLVFIDAINNLDLKILIPVIIGAGVGLVVFSHALSWIYKKFRNQTISALTGFILGSLAILWPWKNAFDSNGELIQTNEFGAFINSNGQIIKDIKVFSYNQVLPEQINNVEMIAVALVVLGFVSIWLMEKFAGNNK